MPKLTKDQIIKWSAQCFNGFAFDWQYYLTWGEKQASKRIDISADGDDTEILEAVIGWTKITENYRVVGYAPDLTLRVWRGGKTDGVMVSRGMGSRIYLTDERFQRKVWKTLAAFTADWTETKILELAQDKGIVVQLAKETAF